MVKLFHMLAGGAFLALTSCAEQHISQSLAETAMVEGLRYAEEVEAQSPFETVEMRWIEAAERIKTRNPDFVEASRRHTLALQGKPLVAELTREVKSTVKISFGDILKPDSLVDSLKAPTLELPKRLASLSKLKDLSHKVERTEWQDAETTVEAEMDMRKIRVRLHRLLREGKLLDRELAWANADPDPEAAASDPKFSAALGAWRSSLQKAREKWLNEVRDLFDAEYQDVHFIPDDSGFPTYRDAKNPDLTEWQRWSHLSRSKELIDHLSEAHQKSKPTIPGTDLVTNSLIGMFKGEREAKTVRETSAVREEVRSLISSWRRIKKDQREAARLEKKNSERPVKDRGQISARQKIFQLRSDEIKQAAVVWMLDEKCWE